MPSSPLSASIVPSTPHIPQEVAIDMRHLLANASNADECRVILDMFLARSGIPLSIIPTPTVSDKVESVDGASTDEGDVTLEHTLVGMFLSDTRTVFIRKTFDDESTRTNGVEDTTTTIRQGHSLSPPSPYVTTKHTTPISPTSQPEA